MPSYIKIDQVGLAPGAVGRSRTDGLSNGSQITLTDSSVGGSTRFELLWVPIGDVTAVATLVANPLNTKEWTFSPTPSIYGTYRIKLTRNEGTSAESTEVRLFRVRTPNGLILPALNERADEDASLVNYDGAVVEASEDNALDYVAGLSSFDYAGWFRPTHELIKEVDALISYINNFKQNEVVDEVTGFNVRFLPQIDSGTVTLSGAGDIVVVDLHSPSRNPVTIESGYNYTFYVYAHAYLANNPHTKLLKQQFEQDIERINNAMPVAEDPLIGRESPMLIGGDGLYLEISNAPGYWCVFAKFDYSLPANTNVRLQVGWVRRETGSP